MGRELRRVPITNTLAGHPRRSPRRDGRERLQPMYDEEYGPAIDAWIAGYELWKRREYHLVPENSYCVGEDCTPEQLYAENMYWDYCGGPPDPEYYRPPHPEGVELGIQLWETTTEGTPQSEVYPDTEQGLRDLCAFAAVNVSTFAGFHATADEWFRMLSDGLLTTADPSMPGVRFL